MKNQFNLEIASTPNCNMACTYCFEGEELKSKSKQTLENIDLIVNKMEDLLISYKFLNEYSGICLNFWGGEPTINYDWNKKLIETIRGKEWADKVTYFIYSNGFDFKKVQKHIDLFSETDLENDILRLQISWDGIPGERIDHKGKQTSVTIEKNIKNIALCYPKLNLKIKATIQPEELLILKSVWTKFFDLHNYITKNCPDTKLRVNFSPTLNYIEDFETSPSYLEKIRESFIGIAKVELQFFKTWGYHLFAWFDSPDAGSFLSKRQTNCSAGVNLMAIDIDGRASVCHGALYSPLKEDFVRYHDTSIRDKDFVPKFFSARKMLKEELHRFDDGCKDCTATVCYKCPIINVEQATKESTEPLSKKEIKDSFQDRDQRHCEIYKIFGLIDRSLYKLKMEPK